MASSHSRGAPHKGAEMKKAHVILWTAIIGIFLSSAALAEPATSHYMLEEVGISVDIPSDLIVLTRDIQQSDPVLKKVGMTADKVKSTLEASNIYLDAVSEDGNSEILIIMTPSSLVDFNLLSDSMISATEDSLRSAYESGGVTDIDSEVYHHSQAKFLKVHGTRQSETANDYFLQYGTAYNNKVIHLTMHSYDGEITAADETSLKRIVDSAVFDLAPQKGAAQALKTASFKYTDPDTGIAFVVPENWKQEEPGAEQETIDAEFSSNEPGVLMMYGKYDLWSKASAADRVGHVRSDVNNSSFTVQDVADMNGIDASKISIETYNGMPYFKSTQTGTNSDYGLDISYEVTQMVCFQNGYALVFQFSGNSSSKYYPDFEKLLNSVEFPASWKLSAAASSLSDVPPRLPGSANITDYSLGNIAFSFVVTVLIYSAPIMIYRFLIKKEPVSKKKGRIITIIYGVFAFIVMLLLQLFVFGGSSRGTAIVLWSYVNYAMLTKGYIERIPSSQWPDV